MFGFGKKRPELPTSPANPGAGVSAEVSFSDGQRNWTENFDLAALAVAALRHRGHKAARKGNWLEDSETGWMLMPQIVDFQPMEGGGARTVTTIETNHSRFAPQGLFEFQHSAGDDLESAIFQGFDQWVQTDFVALQEATRQQPASCMALEMSFPAQDGRPERMRRVILGPVMHYAEHGVPEPEACGTGAEEDAEEHPFCPCCLFTRSMEAFREFLEGDNFVALRLYAARDENQQAQADCRVNGEDFERGAEALRHYVDTWPPLGFEFRKQYVLIHNMSPAGPVA